MKIKKTQIENFNELYNLWKKVGLEIYDFENEKLRFENMIKLNPDLCFCIIVKDKIVGSILGGFDGRNGSIHRLAVIDELQNQGIGTKLIDHLTKRMRQKGIRKLVAQVHISNQKVIDYYKMKGFNNMDYAISFYKDI